MNANNLHGTIADLVGLFWLLHREGCSRLSQSAYFTGNVQHHSTTVIQTPELALWKYWLNARLHSWSGYMPGYNSLLHYDELLPWLIENIHKNFNKIHFTVHGRLYSNVNCTRLMVCSQQDECPIWTFGAINILIWINIC